MSDFCNKIDYFCQIVKNQNKNAPFYNSNEKNIFIFPMFLEFWKSIGAKFDLLAATRQLQNGRCHGREKLPVQRHARIGLYQ